MKIRVAILEQDEIYLNRLKSVFSVKYADKLELYSFTEAEIALQSLQELRIDVFLADEAFPLERAELPAGCVFAVLTDGTDVEKIGDRTAVCKFQKADTLYRQILGLYAEKAATLTGVRMDGEACRTRAFVSAAGGTGCSTAAAACAMYFARMGKKALYLNLEKLGSADVFFRGEGSACLGDVVYAIKSRKGNLALKLESAVKRDASGVFFYSPARLALDMAELSVGETRQIISTLRLSGGYDEVILDLDFSMEEEKLRLLEECDTVVFVADGAETSNVKLERAEASLKLLEQQREGRLLGRCGVLYNRFSSRTSRKAQLSVFREFGGIGRFEGYDMSQLLRELAEQTVFGALD